MTNNEKLVSVLGSVSGSPVVVYAVKPNDIQDNIIVWHHISDIPVRNINQGTYRERTHYQINCFGSSLASCISLATKIKTKLDMNKTDFILATMNNGFHMKDDELELYKYVLDFWIE
jgi:hypothetical protein